MFLYAAAGLLDLDALSCLEYFEQLVAAASLPTHQQPAAFNAADAWLTGQPKWRSLVTRAFMTPIPRVAEFFTNHPAKIRAARLVIAVERYRLAHGTLPATLDDLAPQFVDAVPQDPFNGMAMRYTVTPTGYAVYSVGKDGNDDGGVLTDPAGTSFVPGTDIGMFIRTADPLLGGPEDPALQTPTTDATESAP